MILASIGLGIIIIALLGFMLWLSVTLEQKRILEDKNRGLRNRLYYTGRQAMEERTRRYP